MTHVYLRAFSQNDECTILNGECQTPKSEAVEPTGEAEAYFRPAIETAQRLQANLLELLGATSLARLFQQQGKKSGARELLPKIQNWFAETFGTQDQKETQSFFNEFS